MKPSPYHLITVLLVGALFASSAPGEPKIVADTAKPYLIVTPAKPVTSDIVTIQIMLGTASNSCMAPMFSGLSFTIEQVITVEPMRDITVAQYVVMVKFTQDPLPADKVCPAVYSPVDYGPTFRLGALKAGIYRVVQDGGVTGTLVDYGQFPVVDSTGPVQVSFTIKGTVHDDPYPLKRARMPVAKATVYLIPNIIALSATESSADRMVPITSRDTAITDENGNYSFTKISAGTCMITCSHPDYRTVSLSATTRKDTVIDFTLVPSTASATVTGQVTLVNSDIVRPEPVEGCTVMVELPQMTTLAASSGASLVSLRAITGADGRYAIDRIPITANGQTWEVYAFNGSYTGTKQVTLYNTRTDTADFTFSAAYENKASVTFREAVFTAMASKFVYQQKEAVKIRYTITNTTNTTMTFGPFPQGCEYDLIVGLSVDKELYRASSRALCTMVEGSIVVDPGKTVIHDFPAWYLSDLEQVVASETIVAPRSVTLYFYARLQGAQYDSTMVGVPVNIELEPPLGTTIARRGAARPAVSFNASKEQLTFNLDKPQNVSVKVYTLEGAMVPVGSSQRRFPAGMHTLSLKNIVQCGGLYIVGVKGEGFEKRFSTVHTGR